MINQRLFDHYSIDTTKNLRGVNRCMRPFDTVLIDKRGSCYACECTAWLPQSIGNLQLKPLEDILGSATHQKLKGSIEDGSYRYCNENQCTFLRSGGPNNKETEQGPEQVFQLRLAIDDSCNLRCPSCRKGLIFHKEGKEYNLAIKLVDKINEWLHKVDHSVQVHMGSDGDPFASHVYRHFMINTPVRDNFKYSILTNGLMFGEFHKKIPHIMNNLRELGVSIDGASKDTYEKLRLGGTWERITHNLESIAEAKQSYNFRFTLYFVVQKDNYHQMEEIIQLGRKYGADRINLSRMEDWNVLDDFESVNIFDPAHKLHSDYTTHYNKVKSHVQHPGYGIRVDMV